MIDAFVIHYIKQDPVYEWGDFMTAINRILTLCLVVFTTACIDLASETIKPDNEPNNPTKSEVIKAQLTLSISTDKSRYTNNEIAQISVSVTNNAIENIEIWQNCLGAPLITVKLNTNINDAIFLTHPDEPKSCSAAIGKESLAPGENYTRNVIWETDLGENIPAPNGSYSIEASLTITNEFYNQIDTVNIANLIEIYDNQTYISKTTAFSTAYQQSVITDWYAANQFKKKCYLRDQQEVVFDNNNASINTASNTEESTVTVPGCSIKLIEGPLWQIGFFNKFGSSPADYVIKIDAVTGSIIGMTNNLK